MRAQEAGYLLKRIDQGPFKKKLEEHLVLAKFEGSRIDFNLLSWVQTKLAKGGKSGN